MVLAGLAAVCAQSPPPTGSLPPPTGPPPTGSLPPPTGPPTTGAPTAANGSTSSLVDHTAQLTSVQLAYALRLYDACFPGGEAVDGSCCVYEVIVDYLLGHAFTVSCAPEYRECMHAPREEKHEESRWRKAGDDRERKEGRKMIATRVAKTSKLKGIS
mgnify:CR=1 FL=1